MIELRFALRMTTEFRRWLAAQSAADQVRILSRLNYISLGQFGVSRSLGTGLLELKWKNGLRVYFSRKRVAGIDIFVLWGGFKATQSRDISKARGLKLRSEHEAENEEREKNES